MFLAQLNRDASSAERLRERLNRTGETLDGHPLWTNDEDEVLKRHYPDFQTIRAKLPRRNKNSIWFRCQRIGLKQKRHQWLASEIAKLRKIYPNGSPALVMREFPNVSWDAIKKVAKYYGITRNYRTYHYRRTGQPAMDMILSRLEEIRWTLRDLDSACETGTYFQDNQWRRYRPNFEKIERAVRELDGELKVVWKDYD